MKKNLFLTGTLAIVLVFALAVVGCDTGSGNNDNTGGNQPSGGNTGGFTLTGIPSEYNGKYAGAQGANETGGYFTGAESMNVVTDVTVIKFARISNGSVTIPLWTFNENTDSASRFSGSGSFSVLVAIYNEAEYDYYAAPLASLYFTSPRVAFSNGSATKVWGEGTLEDPSDYDDDDEW